MSEYLGERLPNVADRVKHLQDAHQALSVDGKSLAEIHPTVSQDVETDASNEDFGRIKNIGTAASMAHLRNEKWDGEENWIVDQNIDRRIANEIQGEVTINEGEEAGHKAAQDYLITQGYEGPIRERSSEIFHDQYHRMVNPVAALRDIIKTRKSKKSESHQR